MKCEKCGVHITTVEINEFRRGGGDVCFQVPIAEYKDSIAVEFKTDKTWTGYDLTEEEQSETILCPGCGEFPFKDKEIHVYESVSVVCFKEGTD